MRCSLPNSSEWPLVNGWRASGDSEWALQNGRRNYAFDTFVFGCLSGLFWWSIEARILVWRCQRAKPFIAAVGMRWNDALACFGRETPQVPSDVNAIVSVFPYEDLLRVFSFSSNLHSLVPSCSFSTCYDDQLSCPCSLAQPGQFWHFFRNHNVETLLC